tara:strand:- start:19 stop:228 length:210 start_codon:yes stop_codon:yes gene_type:complete
MQIACRNCKSIYEVNSSDIPISGREVQCYKCREIWFVRKISDRDFQNQYQTSIPTKTENLITEAEKLLK